ncbi:MAG: endonuclease/exonuclease/phosphatase family protein [Anaerolineales bacterium]
MESMKKNMPMRKLILSGIFFMVFFQLLTEFVESIYLFGLLGTKIPPEIALVALFFSPILLLFFKKQLITSNALKILLSIGLLARVVEIMLPTQGRLITSGVGVASLLLFIPSYLAAESKSQIINKFIKEIGAGLTLALFTLILLRALNSGSDLSAQGMFRIISWIISITGLILVWISRPSTKDEISRDENKNRFQTYLYTLGISSILVLLYFSFTAPNIISRWAGTPNLVINIILLTSWIITGYWWMRNEIISPNLLLGIGFLFVLSLMVSILPNQVHFPVTMDNGYPLLEPEFYVWENLAVYIMVALSPILLINFTIYLDRILKNKPTPRVLSGAFTFGAGFILFMILAQVFTTVYDYIPVIGPVFRDKYWVVFLIPSLLSILPLFAFRNENIQVSKISSQEFKPFIWLLGGIAFSIVAGLILTAANPPFTQTDKNTLRIFTYNIQQGFNDEGERNFDGQLNYIRSMSPDIIGLQECDTARIAGGNADIVSYFANHLDMYSYYGPSNVTGTFGIALLSRYPIENPKTYYLFSIGEQVAVIEAEITVGDQTFNIYVTHLGNGGPIFQMRQMLELMRGKSNIIAMGDFNFRPYEEQYKITTVELNDAYQIAQTKTIPSLWGETKPFDIGERIDHIFISEGLQVPYLEYLTQPESDHPGLFAEIGW